MHLLAARPGAVSDGSEAVDLGQSPADILVLSAADSELACLATARGRLPEQAFASLRLASLLHLGHNMSVDLYVETVVAHAKLVVVRLLGGHGYWPYGVEQVAAVCRERGIRVAFLPGDDQPDPDLTGFSTVPPDICHRLWQYCVHGGVDNAVDFLRYCRLAHRIRGRVAGSQAVAARRPVLAGPAPMRSRDRPRAMAGRSARGRGDVLPGAGPGRQPEGRRRPGGRSRGPGPQSAAAVRRQSQGPGGGGHGGERTRRGAARRDPQRHRFRRLGAGRRCRLRRRSTPATVRSCRLCSPAATRPAGARKPGA